MNNTKEIEKLKTAIKESDAIIIGAGAGLSTSAGFSYSGERFNKYFSDFHKKYPKINDMYFGGFYNFASMEEHWAWWSRHIYINRYVEPLNDTYTNLLNLVKDKDYFVLTTNTDHQLIKAGFSKERIFYTQGDYGLWQCSKPCHQETYDNEEVVYKMLLSQGFLKEENGQYVETDPSTWKMAVSSDLIPHCPHCGRPMTMNLRCDDTFVQDKGWDEAMDRYQSFLENHRNKKVLFLELGTGWNTPVIIKYNFWRMTYQWPHATYVCINLEDMIVPDEIKRNSICISDDINNVLKQLL